MKPNLCGGGGGGGGVMKGVLKYFCPGRQNFPLRLCILDSDLGE